MALSKTVEDSLTEAESNLRNALAFAARQERPMVCSLLLLILSVVLKDYRIQIRLDKLENRKPGDNGLFDFFETGD